MPKLWLPSTPRVDCVFKLGGSLLERADWPNRLRAWLAQQPAGVYLGIVGGGAIIEAMRQLDRTHGLGPIATHWQCIRLLDTTLDVAAELVPEFQKLSDWEACLRFCEMLHEPSGYPARQRVAWVRVGCFYSPQIVAEQIASELRKEQTEWRWPREDWSTTTDTLGLLLARFVQAQRCVLLKSCPVDGLSLQQAAAEGIVDSESPYFSEHIPKVELHRL